MTLPTKTINAMVSDMIATWAAETNINQPTFADGDILLAWWQSVAVQLDFLQAQVALVVAMARAQTSTGTDLDTWMAQFGFFRLPATFASGTATLSNSVAASTQIVVLDGSIIQTLGGTIQYQVVADVDEQAYNSALQGYVLQPGQTSMNVTVQALVSGSVSNVIANALVQFGSGVPGIASVTNLAPIQNGVDAESDTAFRARFILYLATLAKATHDALLAAAESVQQGLLLNLQENVDANGNPLMGAFTVIVDDGSGTPPTSVLNAVFAAVDETRAFSVQPFVTDPIQLPVAIAIVIKLATGVDAPTTNTAVQNAIALMVNDLGPGIPLYVSAVESTALGVTGVIAVRSGTTLNTVSADIVPAVRQECRTVVTSISVNNY